MPDNIEGFLQISERLRAILGLASDAELARRLGFEARAWSHRKNRGSIPRKQIDSLLADEQLNPEYVYEGKGSVHIPFDGEAWKLGLHRRLRGLLGYETYVKGLVSNGYKPKELKALADGKADVTVELLRDLRVYIKADLHAVICDEPAVTAEEMALLGRYRRADADGRQTIDAVAAYAVKEIR